MIILNINIDENNKCVMSCTVQYENNSSSSSFWRIIARFTMRMIYYLEVNINLVVFYMKVK